MARLYVGNLDSRVTAEELEDEFRVYGVLQSVWVARKPPGFAFIDFDDKRDTEDAIRDLDGNARMDGELSCLAIPVVVIGMVGLRVSAISVVKLGTLLMNAVYVLVLEVWAVEGVAAGAPAAAPDTAGVRATVEEVTALVIALQDAAVFHQLVSAAIVDHHSTTVSEMILPVPTEVMVPDTVVAGVRPEVRA